MKHFQQFVRTTLIGGFLFLVPVLASLFLLKKAFGFISKLVVPAVKLLPLAVAQHRLLADLLACLILVLVAFGAGLLARTAVGQRFRERLESGILQHVPGYTIYKNFFDSQDDNAPPGNPVQVVLARVDDAWLWAFLMEAHPDGMLTVFVPGAPSPTAGNVYLMEESQVQRVNVPMKTAVKCIRQLGVGSAAAFLAGRLPDDQPLPSTEDQRNRSRRDQQPPG